jgi:hypothetical protein
MLIAGVRRKSGMPAASQAARSAGAALDVEALRLVVIGREVPTVACERWRGQRPERLR